MRYSAITAIFFAIMIFSLSCKNRPVANVGAAAMLHQNQELLTRIIIHDVFNPPVASRIYAYTSLASYEAMRFEDSLKFPSITNRLAGFSAMPVPDKNKKYDFGLAAAQAFFTVMRKITFSVDSVDLYLSAIQNNYRTLLDDSSYAWSVALGSEVGKLILQRATTDNYLQSRGKPRFTGSSEPGKWRPTPPDYLDGVEYCWGTMKTFVVDSSAQFLPAPPPAYSEDTASEYYRQNMEVYRAGKNLSVEQKEIARYWDDNPFVLEHSGHMMFANKKITPGGHWIGITRIACKKIQASPAETAKAYALVAIAMYDAFISCWEEKYRTNIIRPISVINDKIDPNWTAFLQTPPFPEYPSGHSTITRAAATVLTRLFGDNFAFLDTSDLEYIGMQRHFSSFIAAANEASVSRFYGGIHYLNSVNAGAEQGRKVGEYLIQKLGL